MDRESFQMLFLEVIERICVNVENRLGREIPRNYKITLHGGGYSRLETDINKAVDIMYLGEEKFYRVINIGVDVIERERTHLHISISGHSPSSFDRTWNTPVGCGPFKEIYFENMMIYNDK